MDKWSDSKPVQIYKNSKNTLTFIESTENPLSMERRQV